MIYQKLIAILQNALAEDAALNDATSDALISENAQMNFVIAPRQDIVLCGVNAISICFDLLKKSEKFKDAKIYYETFFQDGDLVKASDLIARGQGNAKLILACERVILNSMQHLSGVATLTRKFVETLDDDKIKILDTRKTTLGLREIEKYAVLIGGGKNHRLNLSDMVLIKDNHIAAFDDLGAAVKKAKEKFPELKIEVECENLRQVVSALKGSPDVIMLDNMGIDLIKEAIKIIDKKCQIEISGGVNLNNIAKYRGCAVDFISIGAITNSAASVDIGLDVL